VQGQTSESGRSSAMYSSFSVTDRCPAETVVGLTNYPINIDADDVLVVPQDVPYDRLPYS